LQQDYLVKLSEILGVLYTVILQDDAISYLIKEPVDSATNPHFTALVYLAVEPL
jgi:hypothetical protein